MNQENRLPLPTMFVRKPIFESDDGKMIVFIEKYLSRVSQRLDKADERAARFLQDVAKDLMQRSHLKSTKGYSYALSRLLIENDRQYLPVNMSKISDDQKL
jgi:hypothetical protein